MGLFSKKKDDGKNKSGSTPAPNPYAAAPAGREPYGHGASHSAQPSHSNPPPYQNGPNDRFRQEKSPAVTGPGAPYGNNHGSAPPGYGRSQGYGASQYDGTADVNAKHSGYGGLGRTNSRDTMSTDAGRDALFGNASQRHQQSVPNGGYGQKGGHGGGPAYGTNGSYQSNDTGRNELFGNAPQRAQQGYQNGGFSQSGVSGGSGAYDNSTYGSAQKTAEEEEEEQVLASKQEIKFIKQQDVSSIRNARMLLAQAQESAGNTLGNLQGQRDRLTNVELNLDRSSTQNKVAEENTKKLDKLNRSMFSIVGNPSSKKLDLADEQSLRQRQEERAEAQRLRTEGYRAKNKGEEFHRSLAGNSLQKPPKTTLAERGKFQFEADSDDDAMEEEIEGGVDELYTGVKILKGYAHEMNREIEFSNKQIDSIHRKTDKVDDQIANNRRKLDRIH
ncbi:hypothetical protein GQ43DRAFT_482496 [Delitschia confertaspora ATCC 74209]|uniref:t-SNARE coiled-coil homology domain-containing protein n=1 Tax=Delitschia confertaspora ATCC 74209 TaxID=1513339 RepID=A0A9P4JM93_9PLEO|nr:hypothetical protein GQ43DRAFT_482496 [Delitschia confertaspora ATCC 74209]